MSVTRTPQHRLVLERVPAIAPTSPRAWGLATAAVAAWPSFEPARPAVERRFWRAGVRGALRETIVASLADPLALLSAADARAELLELARPLRAALALREVAPATVASFDALPFSRFAELSSIDQAGPESRRFLAELFADLVAGVEQLRGPVALSLLVAPPRPCFGDDEEDELAEGSDRARAARGVTFRLRIASTVAVPAAIRARAESVCLAGPAGPDCWAVADDTFSRDAFKAAMRAHEPVVDATGGRQTSATVAAVTIALPGPAHPSRTLVGRPVAGPLPASGAPLGRVPRPTGRMAPWRLDWETRTHHVLITGGTGAGKTTAISRVALDDLEQGRGLILIDPHGDLARTLEPVLAGHAGTLYVDPREEPARPLDLLHPDPRRADAAVQSAMRELWPAEFSGPVFQRHVSIALRLLVAGGYAPTIGALDRYFANPALRDELLRQAGSDLRAEAAPVLHALRRPSNDDSSVVDWVASKFSPLAQGPARALFDRPDPTTWEERVARGDACVVCLPTGVVGDAGARMTGRMLITRLTQALAAQAALPEDQRHPCSVIIDEAHLFAGPALGALFAQVRKFGGALTVATQAPSQLGAYRDVVLTNAQTLVSGRISRAEAEALRDRSGVVTADLLPRLPRRHMVVVGEEHDREELAPVLTPIALPDDAAARDAVAARAATIDDDPVAGEQPDVPAAPADAEAAPAGPPERGASVVDALRARRASAGQRAAMAHRPAG